MHAELFIFINIFIGEVFSICAPSELEFWGFEEKPNRHDVMQVEVSSKKCRGQYILYYLWKVVDYSNGDVIQVANTPHLFVDGYDFTSVGIFEKEFGLSIEVSHYPQMIFSATMEKKFQYQPVPMKIVIAGGFRRTHPKGKLLLVDAFSESKDRSYPENEKVIGDEFIWISRPYIKFNTTSSLILHVETSNLTIGIVYSFEIIVTRNRFRDHFDVGTCEQHIQIVSEKEPVISLNCRRNCFAPHFLEFTLFDVRCFANCRNINYKWKLRPTPLPDTRVDFGDGFDKILLHPFCYNPGDLVVFEVRAGQTSLAYQKLRFMKDIKKGICIVSPSAGVSGITTFTLNCSGFHSDHGNLKYIVYESHRDYHKAMHIIHYKKNPVGLYLCGGDRLIIRVQDRYFMETEITVMVDVAFFTRMFPYFNNRRNLKKLILNDDPGSLVSLTASNARTEVYQKLAVALELLRTVNLTKAELADLRFHFITCVSNLKPHSFLEIEQTFRILSKLYYVTPRTDTEMARLLGLIMKKISGALFYSLIQLREGVPSKIISDFVRECLEFSAGLVGSIKEVESMLQEEERSYDYQSYDDLKHYKVQARDDIRELVDNVLHACQAYAIATMLNYEPNQKSIMFYSDFIFLYSRRVTLDMLRKGFFGHDFPAYTGVTLSQRLIRSLRKRNLPYIDYQFAVISRDIFWWLKNISHYTADLFLVDFFFQKYKIVDTKDVILLNFLVRIPYEGNFEGYISGPPESVTSYRVSMKPHSQLLVALNASSAPFKVLISDRPCKEKDMRDARLIAGNPVEITGQDFPWAFEQYLCIQKLVSEPIKVVGTVVGLACTHYNTKDSSWLYRGCTVEGIFPVQSARGRLLTCACRKRSMYGAVTYIPHYKKNVIANFSAEIEIEITKQWVPLLLIISLLALFGLFLLLAAILDRNYEQRNIVCRLDDNVPGDSFVYVVVIFTGHYLDAPTTADVGFQIIGEKSSSRNHLIKCCCLKMLKRNSQDWFIVFTPEDLGPLKKIRLWHNCRGKRPHWYCEKIIVQDLKTEQQYFFDVSKWFSLIWGKSRIYHVVPVMKESNMKTKLLLKNNINFQFRERHLWLSVVTRQYQSNFTSKERVGVAFSTLFVSMLASAMLYGVPTKKPMDSINPKTSYYFTFRELLVYFESLLITIPVSSLLIFLFRQTDPFKEDPSLDDD